MKKKLCAMKKKLCAMKKKLCPMNPLQSWLVAKVVTSELGVGKKNMKGRYFELKMKSDVPPQLVKEKLC